VDIIAVESATIGAGLQKKKQFEHQQSLPRACPSNSGEGGRCKANQVILSRNHYCMFLLCNLCIYSCINARLSSYNSRHCNIKYKHVGVIQTVNRNVLPELQIECGACMGMHNHAVRYFGSKLAFATNGRKRHKFGSSKLPSTRKPNRDCFWREPVYCLARC
jgi:hypothetical protein